MKSSQGGPRAIAAPGWTAAHAIATLRKSQLGGSNMRISGVDAIAIDIPLSKNFGVSTYAVLKRSTVITRLRTQDGLVSEVYNGDNREAGHEIVRLIRDELAPLIVGQSIFATERIWSKLFALTLANRDRKTLLEARGLGRSRARRKRADQEPL